MNDENVPAVRAKRISPFLSTEQAAFYLGLSPRMLQKMRALDSGPIFRCHGRYVRYHIDDLEMWSRGTCIQGSEVQAQDLRETPALSSPARTSPQPDAQVFY